jgi:hypothetical protein
MPVYTNCLQLSFTSRRARARHVCEIFLAARAVLSPRGAEKHARPRGEGGGDFRAEMSISDLPHMPDYCSSSPPLPPLGGHVVAVFGSIREPADTCADAIHVKAYRRCSLRLEYRENRRVAIKLP